MKVAVAGTGRIAWSLENDELRYKPCTHIGALCSLAAQGEKLEWDGLCDIDHDKILQARDYIRNHIKQKIDPCLATDFRELLQRTPDLFIIAADTDAHFPMLQSAIELKIPRIVVEKPIVLTKQEAAQLQTQVARGNSMIWVNYERRYHQKYRALRSLVREDRRYGKVLHYRGWLSSGQKNLYPHEQGEGVLLHDTTHLLDLAFFLFGSGEATPISPDKKERTSLIEIIHPSRDGQEQITGEILTTVGAKAFHFEIEILFEQARIRAGNGFLHLEEVEESPYYKGFRSLGKLKVKPDKKMVFKDNPFIRLYTDVLKGDLPENIIEEACANIVALSP